MESDDELKEIDIKNCMCYYFPQKIKIIKIEDFDFGNILLDENHKKISWFMTFHAKL